jgi:hypothetical protein
LKGPSKKINPPRNTGYRYSDVEKAEAIIRLAVNHYAFQKTADELGIPVQTIRRWNKRYSGQWVLEHQETPSILEEYKNRYEQDFYVRLNTPGNYSESEFVRAICGRINQIADAIGLPEIEAFTREEVLPNKKRIDILCKNLDGSLTIIEVKTYSGNCADQKMGWLGYSAIGQLLYYAEVIKSAYGIRGERLHLCFITDCVLDRFTLAALGSVKKKIHVFNARAVFDEFGSSGN